MSVIEDVYSGLRSCELAASQYDFSRGWCGRSRSYLSWLKSAKTGPSIAALATLLLRMEQEAERLEKADDLAFPEVAEHDAKALRRMAISVKSELLAVCGLESLRSTDDKKDAQ